MRGLTLLTCLVIGLCLRTVDANDTSTLFKTIQDRIYQVQIIEIASGSKSSLGSAFQIGADGLLVTNFHVIADFVHEPEKYRVEYIDYLGDTGVLEILDIDVVNDLALVRHQGHLEHYLRLAEQIPEKGEEVYSLGNPHDLGMTVVPGTYNSLTAHSYYDRILFSGSINPGMSGGPALNSKGEVIGVNVATSGNQLSFLVPVNKLKNLLARFGSDKPATGSLRERVQRQLSNNQKIFIQTLLDAEWPRVELGGGSVIGEMTFFTRCWGSSDDNEDERLEYRVINSNCTNNEYIYLSDRFITGGLQYEFSWLESDTLMALQFYRAYQENIGSAVPVNWAGEKDVTNYQCNENFTQQSSDEDIISKSIFCVRAYKEYDDLYDMLYVGATVHENRKGLISHFTIAGIDKQQGLEFTRKFMEHIKWTSSLK